MPYPNKKTGQELNPVRLLKVKTTVKSDYLITITFCSILLFPFNTLTI